MAGSPPGNGCYCSVHRLSLFLMIKVWWLVVYLVSSRFALCLLCEILHFFYQLRNDRGLDFLLDSFLLKCWFGAAVKAVRREYLPSPFDSVLILLLCEVEALKIMVEEASLYEREINTHGFSQYEIHRLLHGLIHCCAMKCAIFLPL